MTANSSQVEKFAIALPTALVKLDLMIIVIAAKGKRELVELKTLLFLRVEFGLFDFSDHSVIHMSSPGMKMGTEAQLSVPVFVMDRIVPYRS
jgi:hypothetical protein